jgi:pyruvate kinase
MNFKNFAKTDVIHINYGEVSLKVEEAEGEFLKCIALNSGLIQKNNSLSVEGKEHFSNNLISVEPSKLKKEVQSAVELGVEFLVMSVIDNPVNEIKAIKEMANHVNIVVKIDNPKSIQNIDDYIEMADAIYFSRSDLNLKDSLSKICFYQKSIVSKCGYLGIH